MEARRLPLKVKIEKYEIGKGLEDGFELFQDVVTKGWIVTDHLVKIQRDNGTIVCPYIVSRRGRTFIGIGDFIISEEDGTRLACSEEKIWNRYEKL